MVLTRVPSVRDSTSLLEQKNTSANSLINTNRYTIFKIFAENAVSKRKLALCSINILDKLNLMSLIAVTEINVYGVFK